MTHITKKIFTSLALLSLLLLPPVINGNSAVRADEIEILSTLYHEDSEPVQLIEGYLKTNVPGLSVTYLDVLDAIAAEGYDVYIKGGLIRDLIQDDGKQPIDVDFSFSCTADQLEALLVKHQWHYTRLPGYDFVDIGDRNGLYLEGTPLCWTLVDNEYKLDFTVNNILYHYNTKKFIDHSDIGINDVKNRKLNVIANDWKKWLYAGDPEEKCGTKIFRFWKMVAKGYIYTIELENLIYSETLTRQQQKPELFRTELIDYLSCHYRNFEEVVRGARLIMGNEWVEETIIPLEEEIIKKEQSLKKELDEHTHF